MPAFDKENTITCRMTMSKWRPNQVVPTYFVSPRPRKGCFTQVNDAIQYAQPYSRIELLSGTYNECVLLNKSVEIGSEKGDEQAVIMYHMTALILQTAEGYIEGVTIRSSEAQAAVRIDKGAPILARCELGGVEVGGDASPLIEECKIEGSAVHGLSVLQVAGGMYKGNSIVNNGWYGISVETTGPATFMHNTVTESAQGQIVVRGNSNVNPMFQYNRIIDQRHQSADGNLLHQTQAYKLEHLPVKGAGQQVLLMPVEMTTSIKSSLSDDAADDAIVLSTETRAAIDVQGGAHPSFIRNTIVGSMNNGFYIHGGAHGNYEHNYITSNKGWGFVVDGDTTVAHIVANSINSNGGGIKAVGSPSTVDGKNELVENRGPQLMLINGHEEFLFTMNEIRSGPKIGILCREGGQGKIDHNAFDQCATGVRVETGANPTIIQNMFTMCSIGVFACKGGRGIFYENEFGNLTAMCALVSTFATPVFTECRFLTSNGGALVTKGGRGVFRGCIFKDNKGVQFEVSDRGDPYVTECFMADGRDDGVKVHHKGKGKFYRNLIAGNERSQVCIRTGADPVIDENIITRSHYDGILVEDGGNGVITSNIVERCRMSGISVGAKSFPTVRGNVITLNREAGLLVSEGGDGVFEKNDIFMNRKTNVQVAGSGVADKDSLKSVLIRSNKIYASPGFGLIASSKCEVTVADNYFHGNENCAVKVTNGSDVTILRNEFVAGKEGIYGIEDSRVKVFANTFSEIQGTAATFDEGAKCVCMWNVFDHCTTAIILRNTTGMCFLNSILQSTATAVLLGSMCRALVRNNMLFSNTVGMRFESRTRAVASSNTIFESETHGIVVEGDDVHNAQIEGNVVLNSRAAGIAVFRGAPRISSNLVMNNATGVLVRGDTAAPHLFQNYISCSQRGVHWEQKGHGKLESCIVGHCEIGLHLSNSLSTLVVKGNVVHNCTVSGILLSDSGDGDIMDCVTFKSFLNVLSMTGAKVTLSQCLLQAPVAFNVVCTKGSCISLSRCIVASRAMASDDDGDEQKEVDHQAKVIRLNLLKRFGEKKMESMETFEFRIRSLWDDHYSSDPAAPIGGHPREWFPEDHVIQSDAAKKGGGGDGQHDTSRPESATSRSSRPSSAMSSASATTVAEDDGSEAAFSDLTKNSPKSDRRDSRGHVTLADVLLSRTAPLPRRTAVLHPTNINESPEDYIGPGGPLVLHKAIGGDQLNVNIASLKGLYTYCSSGVLVDDGSTPSIEACLIRDHYFRPIKSMSKRLPPYQQSAQPLALKAMLQEKNTNELLRKVRSKLHRASSVSQSTLTNAPAPPSAKKSRSNLRKQVIEIKAQDGEIDDKREQRETTEEEKNNVELLGTPVPIDRRAWIDRLLLACSPTYYQHPNAPHPKDFIPELFTAPDEEVRGETQDGKEVLANDKAKALLGVAAAYLQEQERQYVTTSCTQDFTGFGVIYTRGGGGTLARTTILRNTMGVKIEGSSNPTITSCTVTLQNVHGFWIKAGGLGTLKHNKISKNVTTQIRVQDAMSNPSFHENEVFDSASPGAVFSEGCRGSMIQNRFTKIAAAAVISELSAEPQLKSNRMFECQQGILYRLGGVGTASANTVLSSTKCGILIEGDLSSPSIERNIIVESKEQGVLVVGEGARPTLQENEVSRNGTHGIELRNGCAGNYMSNQLHHNSESGVCVTTASSGLFEGNEFYANKGSGMRVGGGANPFVQNNVFTEGEAFGVCVEDATGTYSQNRIFDNVQGGIKTNGTGCYAIFEQNEIDNNQQYGVICEEGSRAEFTDNIVTRHAQGGVFVEGKMSNPSFKGNYFKMNGCFAMKFTYSCSATVEESFIVLTDGNGVEIANSASPTITTSIVALNTSSGIYCSSGAGGCVSDCIITKCDRNGLMLEESGSQFRLKNSLVMDCDCSVLATSRSCGGLIGNFFLGRSRNAAVCLNESSQLALDTNAFIDQKVGIADNGCSRLADCFFNSCVTAIMSAGSSTVSTTEFRECNIGVQVTDGGTKFEECSFVNCSKFGAVLSGSGAVPDFDKCSFQRCRLALALECGGGVVQNCEIFNCADGIATSSDAEVKNTTVYDCSNVGIIVKDGKPTITTNLVFDNFNASVILDKGQGVLEDNKLYFARDEGALVIRPTALTLQNRNTIKNSFSPPREKNPAERAQLYKRQEQEKEKSSALFRKHARNVDTLVQGVLKALGGHIDNITAAASGIAGWVLSEDRSPKPERKSNIGKASPVLSPKNGADPFANVAAMPVTPPPPQAEAEVEVRARIILPPSASISDDVFLPTIKDRISNVLDGVRPAIRGQTTDQQPNATVAAPGSATLPPVKPKGSRASVGRKSNARKSVTSLQ